MGMCNADRHPHTSHPLPITGATPSRISTGRNMQTHLTSAAEPISTHARAPPRWNGIVKACPSWSLVLHSPRSHSVHDRAMVPVLPGG
jgi:hypothetical protein